MYEIITTIKAFKKIHELTLRNSLRSGYILLWSPLQTFGKGDQGINMERDIMRLVLHIISGDTFFSAFLYTKGCKRKNKRKSW